MQCNEFLEYAGQWMEGEQDSVATAHLDACPHCRALVADLTAIQASAGALEAEVEPPAQLWTSIRTQLEAEGIIHEPAGSWAERLADWLHPSPRMVLAGAYLSLLLILSALVSFDSVQQYNQARGIILPSPEIAAMPDQLAHAGDRAASSLEASNPGVAASYRESLRTIDSLIVECENTVRRDPQNELAREYLYGAYQQKAELLSAMVERGAYGE